MQVRPGLGVGAAAASVGFNAVLWDFGLEGGPEPGNVLIRLEYLGICTDMEGLLARMQSLMSGGQFSIEWLTGLLGLMLAYAFGYFCGILPSFFHRRRRRAQERSAILCAEILGKICNHEDLCERYICETDPEKRDRIGREITVLRGDLRQLEFRLAMLEQREPRRLPLRPLPVRQLKIEWETDSDGLAKRASHTSGEGEYLPVYK